MNNSQSDRSTQEKGASPSSKFSSQEWFILIILGLAQLGTSSDNGAFTIANAAIMQNLGAVASDIQLANTLYSLIAGALMLVSAMLSVVFGPNRTLRAGLLLAAIAEAVAATTHSMLVLTWGGRLLMGVAASLIIPAIFALIVKCFAPEHRRRAFGMIAAFAALAALSPIALGMITDKVGYRVTFATLSAYFAVLLALAFKLPRPQKIKDAHEFDGVGSLVLAIAFFLVLYGCSKVSVWGVFYPLDGAPSVWGISPSPLMVAGGLLLLGLIIPYEKKREEKVGTCALPFVFIRSSRIRAGLIAIALPYFYLGAQGMVGTFYFQLVLGLGATQTALLGIVTGIPMIGLALILSGLGKKVRSFKVVGFGYIAIALGSALMAYQMQLEAMSAFGYAAIFIGAVGVGCINSQSNNMVASAAPEKNKQQSGGIQGMARNLSIALGVALMGSVLLVSVNADLDRRVAQLPEISAQTQQLIDEKTIGYMPDAALAAEAQKMQMGEAEKTAFINAYCEARSHAGRVAMLTMSCISALSLLSLYPYLSKKETTE